MCVHDDDDTVATVTFLRSSSLLIQSVWRAISAIDIKCCYDSLFGQRNSPNTPRDQRDHLNTLIYCLILQLFFNIPPGGFSWPSSRATEVQRKCSTIQQKLRMNRANIWECGIFLSILIVNCRLLWQRRAEERICWVQRAAPLPFLISSQRSTQQHIWFWTIVKTKSIWSTKQRETLKKTTHYHLHLFHHPERCHRCLRCTALISINCKVIAQRTQFANFDTQHSPCDRRLFWEQRAVNLAKTFSLAKRKLVSKLMTDWSVWNSQLLHNISNGRITFRSHFSR